MSVARPYRRFIILSGLEHRQVRTELRRWAQTLRNSDGMVAV